VHRNDASEAGYWIAFAVCAAAATLPFLVTGSLPMADLPEHLAQVAIWKHYRTPCHDFASLYELHYATPYLLGYVVVRILATVVSVTTAAKVAVWLAIVLLPLSLRRLLLRAGASAWPSLLGFALAFGYSFYWGFLNFLLALPIALWHASLLFERRPRVQTFAGVLLVASHGLLFALAAAFTLAFAAVRRTWGVLLTLVPGAALLAAFLLTRQTTDDTITWKLGASRLTDFSSLLFANAWEPAGLVLVAAMGLAVALAHPRLTRDGRRWAFFAVALAAYGMLPFGMAGTAYVYPRFAVFVAAGLLLLPEIRPGPAARVAFVAIPVLWCAIVAVRFHRFDEEARELDSLLLRTAPARRLAQLNVDPFSENVPGPVFWHSGALYTVRRGGMTAWSFASLESWYPSIVRFRVGAEPVNASRTTPLDGMDWKGLLQYDYLLVRGSDPRRSAFRDAPQPLSLEARSGAWWLFATPRAASQRRGCRPLDE